MNGLRERGAGGLIPVGLCEDNKDTGAFKASFRNFPRSELHLALIRALRPGTPSSRKLDAAPFSNQLLGTPFVSLIEIRDVCKVYELARSKSSA